MMLEWNHRELCEVLTAAAQIKMAFPLNTGDITEML